jgi:hypothetical protein
MPCTFVRIIYKITQFQATAFIAMDRDKLILSVAQCTFYLDDHHMFITFGEHVNFLQNGKINTYHF